MGGTLATPSQLPPTHSHGVFATAIDFRDSDDRVDASRNTVLTDQAFNIAYTLSSHHASTCPRPPCCILPPNNLISIGTLAPAEPHRSQYLQHLLFDAL
jgi:hypothetical protein